VYALGIILYEMLTGQPPFVAEGFGEVLMMHQIQPPRRPRELRPDIPASVEDVILRALAKTRDERVSSMSELQALLAGETRLPIAMPPEQPAPMPGTTALASPSGKTALLPDSDPGSADGSGGSGGHALPATRRLPSQAPRATTLSTGTGAIDLGTAVRARRGGRLRILTGAAVAVGTALVGVFLLARGAPHGPVVEPAEPGEPAEEQGQGASTARPVTAPAARSGSAALEPPPPPRSAAASAPVGDRDPAPAPTAAPAIPPASPRSSPGTSDGRSEQPRRARQRAGARREPAPVRERPGVAKPPPPGVGMRKW
jgi:serine/threonine-protein kinase